MTDHNDEIIFNVKKCENGYMIMVSYGDKPETCDKNYTFVGHSLGGIENIIGTILKNNFEEKKV